VAVERARRARPRSQEAESPRARAKEPAPEVVKKPRPKNKRVVARARDESGILPVSRESRLRTSASSLIARARGFGGRFRSLGMSLLRVLSLLGALAGAVAVGRLVQQHLTTSQAFAIDHVDIRGLLRMTRAEVLAAAGIDVGTNVFAKSPEEVRARLLKHPWIAAATVHRKLPSRFEIDIREREAAALLVVESCPEGAPTNAQDESCDDPSSLYLVSDEAIVFKRLEGQDPADLPVITGVNKKRLAADREAQERLLKEAVALLGEYRGAGLFKRLAIGEIHIEPTGGISLYVGDDLTHVRLGAPPYGHKLKRMKKVFDRLQRERASAEYVYLDNELRPDRVTVRLR
jgi:cell division protein FtsQ